MSTIQRKSNQVSFNKILGDAVDLKVADLENVLRELSSLLQRKKSPKFSPHEQKIIYEIKYGGLTEELKKRRQELAQKSANGTMTEVENKEALELVPIFEQRDLERLKLVNELGEIWGVSLEEVMRRLEIKSPTDVSS